MRRYRLRHYLLLGILLGTPALTCGVTLRGVHFRLLQVEAELNRQPVVIDANGVEVGTVVDIPGGAAGGAVVLMDVEGFPLFVLRQRPDGLFGTTGGALFQSNDCSGAAFIEPRNPSNVFPSVFHLLTKSCDHNDRDLRLNFLDGSDELVPIHVGHA